MSAMVGSPNASVMIVERTRNDMSAYAYRNRLEAVLAMIDNGSLGDGIGYGCDEHKAALDQVEKQIAETRDSIARMDDEDASGNIEEPI